MSLSVGVSSRLYLRKPVILPPPLAATLNPYLDPRSLHWRNQWPREKGNCLRTENVQPAPGHRPIPRPVGPCWGASHPGLLNCNSGTPRSAEVGPGLLQVAHGGVTPSLSTPRSPAQWSLEICISSLEQHMVTYLDSVSLFQRRKQSQRGRGHVQDDTVCVRTQTQTTLVSPISTPFTFALWVLAVA